MRRLLPNRPTIPIVSLGNEAAASQACSHATGSASRPAPVPSAARSKPCRRPLPQPTLRCLHMGRPHGPASKPQALAAARVAGSRELSSSPNAAFGIDPEQRPMDANGAFLHQPAQHIGGDHGCAFGPVAGRRSSPDVASGADSPGVDGAADGSMAVSVVVQQEQAVASLSPSAELPRDVRRMFTLAGEMGVRREVVESALSRYMITVTSPP